MCTRRVQRVFFVDLVNLFQMVIYIPAGAISILWKIFLWAFSSISVSECKTQLKNSTHIACSAICPSHLMLQTPDHYLEARVILGELSSSSYRLPECIDHHYTH
jgi:hypothetical protein